MAISRRHRGIGERSRAGTRVILSSNSSLTLGVGIGRHEVMIFSARLLNLVALGLCMIRSQVRISVLEDFSRQR